MPAAYYVFQSLSIEERVESLTAQIKQIEDELDLRDYYDIKRPTIVQFG